jgi:hypothetical protein
MRLLSMWAEYPGASSVPALGCGQSQGEHLCPAAAIGVAEAFRAVLNG